MNTTIEPWMLVQRQGLSLEAKIALSKLRIKEWYEFWEGNIYVSFSGGLDSTVLLDITRSIYPDTPAVFCDTGLEYPEIKDFVRTVDNTVWLKPKLSYRQVIDRYGYPLINKQVAMGLDRYRNTKSQVQRNLYLYGGINPTSGKTQRVGIPQKYHYLINAPFNISERCCDVMKKSPAHRYGRETNKKAIIGTMATDSNMRKMLYYANGCNAFNLAYPTSTPISFWMRNDILEYIKVKDIAYSRIYDMGETHTGCIFCMFGVHMEEQPNRFQRLKSMHPKLWNYCMYELNLEYVLRYIGVPYW